MYISYDELEKISLTKGDCGRRVAREFFYVRDAEAIRRLIRGDLVDARKTSFAFKSPAVTENSPAATAHSSGAARLYLRDIKRARS